VISNVFRILIGLAVLGLFIWIGVDAVRAGWRGLWVIPALVTMSLAVVAWIMFAYPPEGSPWWVRPLLLLVAFSLQASAIAAASIIDR
jgi:hypothetical protein